MFTPGAHFMPHKNLPVIVPNLIALIESTIFSKEQWNIPVGFVFHLFLKPPLIDLVSDIL